MKTEIGPILRVWVFQFHHLMFKNVWIYNEEKLLQF
jgi:hypothetical protein